MRGMSLFGGHWFGIFDPFSFFYRALSTSVFPAFHIAVEDTSTAIYNEDPKIFGFHLTSITEPVYKQFRTHISKMSQKTFYTEGTVIAFTLILITGLNLFDLVSGVGYSRWRSFRFLSQKPNYDFPMTKIPAECAVYVVGCPAGHHT
jgi:hypothetical protein